MCTDMEGIAAGHFWKLYATVMVAAGRSKKSELNNLYSTFLSWQMFENDSFFHCVLRKSSNQATLSILLLQATISLNSMITCDYFFSH